MGDSATLHKKEDFQEYDGALCYRTDYSDDSKWRRLLALTKNPNIRVNGCGHEGRSLKPCKGTDDMLVIEGHEYKNMTAQDLQHIATEVYLMADKQSMEDGTFVLAYNDAIFEEDEKTGELRMIGSFLKTTRYHAADIWVPLTSLLLVTRRG
ncbi:hypothetical protein K450DRAFT_226733 [Umbelopsis ramanniana AG]|uniref:DUF6924 domain-containing protein n=1 Tax=Umbelopsis ramanniana AG TaxID=1314678 RepID=A0AAD5HH24_UMBRA|nr:uncharacterized protein K450DRAFT_226733 [Umbelopsis ramanniana AG]KAI8582749.1 hypothetical protein K450DRAFT_226733 [Umbelopsis ramanniana AG]